MHLWAGTSLIADLRSTNRTSEALKIGPNFVPVTDRSNCVSFVVTAKLFSADTLLELALQMLVDNGETVRDSEEWKEAKGEDPELANMVLERFMGGKL